MYTEMINKMKTIRPEINQDLILKIKIEYPRETAMLTNAQTIEWAINKILEAKKIKMKTINKTKQKPTLLQPMSQCMTCTQWNTITTPKEINNETMTFVNFYCKIGHTKPEGYNCKNYKKNPNVEVKE
jgi:hypothetical protein